MKIYIYKYKSMTCPKVYVTGNSRIKVPEGFSLCATVTHPSAISLLVSCQALINKECQQSPDVLLARLFDKARRSHKKCDFTLL